MACSCPQGYTFNSLSNQCEHITQQVIINNPVQYQVGKAPADAKYSTSNAYYGDITAIPLPMIIQSTGWQENLNKFTDSNSVPVPYIGLNTTFFHRLNTIGVWTIGPASMGCGITGGVTNVCPLLQWIGFPFCLNVPGSSPKAYIFGAGGDNAWRVTIDGIPVVNGRDPNTWPLDNEFVFRQWTLFSYTLGPGNHTILIEGLNQSQYAAFGLEIYDATLAQLQACTSATDLNKYIIWNTLVPMTAGGYFVLGETSGISCPKGSYIVATGSNCNQFVCQGVDVTPCQSTCSFTVQLVPVNGTCPDNGEITSIVSPSSSPDYSYLWSNGSTDPDINNLPSGVYTLYVTDPNGCTKSETVSITNPDPIVITLLSFANPTCGAADGLLSIEVVGGTAPYTYSWSNGDSTDTITGLIPGTYIVTVTDSNDCSNTASYNLPEPCCDAGPIIYPNTD